MYGNESAGEVPFYTPSGRGCASCHYSLFVFFVANSVLSDWVSFQRAHVHLHDRRQPALHPADHLPAHLGLHRADSSAAEASD